MSETEPQKTGGSLTTAHAAVTTFRTSTAATGLSTETINSFSETNNETLWLSCPRPNELSMIAKTTFV